MWRFNKVRRVKSCYPWVSRTRLELHTFSANFLSNFREVENKYNSSIAATKWVHFAAMQRGEENENLMIIPS